MTNICQQIKDDPAGVKPCIHFQKSPEKEPGYCKLDGQYRCIESLRRLSPALSSSSVSGFIKCRHYYYLDQVVGIKLLDINQSSSIMMGRAWDEFIQSCYDPMSKEPDLTMIKKEADRAKVAALVQAHKYLNISNHDRKSFLGCQMTIDWRSYGIHITGYADRAYTDHLVETKLTTRVSHYTNPFNVSMQLGTYLLASNEFAHVDMEITRVPGIRPPKESPYGVYEGGEMEAYQEKLYNDIINRPAYYFVGWDEKTRTYKHRIWRAEIPLEEISETYQMVAAEIKMCAEQAKWYRNRLACYTPFRCQFIHVCTNGNISTALYEYKKRKEVE